MTRSQVLERAKSIITKDRNNVHGEPEDSFSNIDRYWIASLVNNGLIDEFTVLEPSDVAHMIALFKQGRTDMNPFVEDSHVDKVGYAAIAAELEFNRRGPGKDE